MAKRDYVAEILERKARLQYRAPIAEMAVRFMNLELAFIRSEQLSDEMMRYFPIALVACIESLFRLSLADLIDEGPPFSDRIVEFENVKVDLVALKAVHGRKVSLGEFLSHMVPLQSMSDINKAFSKLLGDDFLKLLRTRHDNPRDETESGAREFVGMDAGEMFMLVDDTFRLRHIYAHEFASTEQIDRVHIRRCFNASIALMLTATTVLADTASPNNPRSLEEAEEASEKAFEEVEDELSRVTTEVAAKIPEPAAEELGQLQARWRSLRDELAAIYAETNRSRMSTDRMNSLFFARWLTRRRIDELQLLPSVRSSDSAA